MYTTYIDAPMKDTNLTATKIKRKAFYKKALLLLFIAVGKVKVLN